MTRKPNRMLVAAGLAVALAGAGSAYAYSGGSIASHKTASAKAGRTDGPRGPRFATAAAAYLGLTQAELRTQLESGKSLAQVAAAQGKSVAGLKQAILASAKSDLDRDVAAGRITAAQEQTMLADLQSHLDDIVNRTGPPPRPPLPPRP
jgi:hypothetical protein